MKKNQWQNVFPEPSEKFHQRVAATLNSLPPEKEKMTMKIKKRFLVPVLALMATLALGTGLLATGTLSSLVMSSSEKPDYTEVPGAEELAEKLDFIPVVLDEFANGYQFEDASIVKEKALDEQGNVLGKTKSLQCDYVKGNDELIFSANHWDMTKNDTEGDVVATVNGINLRYTSVISKYVGENYVKTEQDKADEAAGKVIFNEGDGKTTGSSQLQGLSWAMDGITYHFTAIDSNLTADDLVAMATELIQN